MLLRFIIVIFALSSSVYSYGQPKSETQEQTQKKKTISKIKWREEPNSFAGIHFYEKIDFPICPLSIRWKEMVASDPNLVACLVLNPTGSQDLNGNPTTQVTLARDVSPLGPIHLIANTENEIVGIKSYFISERYVRLLAIFTERYGPPHIKRQTKLQSNAGAVFEGAAVEWHGQNFDIKLESLIHREYSNYSNSFLETGEFTIYSKAWLRSKGENLMKDVKDKAKNF